MTFPQSLVPTRLCCAFSSIFIYCKTHQLLDFTINCVIILITFRFLTVLHFQAFSSTYDVITSLSTVFSFTFLINQQWCVGDCYFTHGTLGKYRTATVHVHTQKLGLGYTQKNTSIGKHKPPPHNFTEFGANSQVATTRITATRIPATKVPELVELYIPVIYSLCRHHSEDWHSCLKLTYLYCHNSNMKLLIPAIRVPACRACRLLSICTLAT